MSVSSSLPLLVFGGAILGWILVVNGVRWWRRWVSRSWPLTEAEFQQGGLKLVFTGGRTGNRSPRLEVSFTYRVGNQHYQGTYAEIFSDLPEAEQMFESMKAGPLFVRYNPRRLTDYFMDPYRDIRIGTSKFP